MGSVIVDVNRVGHLPIDREVTIDVAKAVSPSDDGSLTCKSVRLSRHEHTWRIELEPGEYRICATWTIIAKDALAFATRLLQSNECNLIVRPGNQPVTLILERLSDGLHLRDDLPALPSARRVNR